MTRSPSLGRFRHLWFVISQNDAGRGIVPPHLIHRPPHWRHTVGGSHRECRARMHPGRAWVGSPDREIVLQHRLGESLVSPPVATTRRCFGPASFSPRCPYLPPS